MNPDAQAGLDTADMIMNDSDPEVRRAYLAAYGEDPEGDHRVNPTDWAKIEDSENDDAYAPPPRKDHTVPNSSSDFLMGEGSDDRDSRPGPWFPAAYPGECSGFLCGMAFSEGDMIRADGEGGWQAQECFTDFPEDHQ